MAPLTRSDHYQIFPVTFRVMRVFPPGYPFTLVLPQMPRLLRFKGSSGSCFSCNGSGAFLRCSECESKQFYCNDVCQAKAWEGHKVECERLKEKIREQKNKKIEDTNLERVSKIINKVFTPGFPFPECKSDPKLEVPIKGNVSFGSLHDVLGQSDLTTREFQPGLYKCTSITPYENCEPLTIYHHKSVDPCKIVKQCVLMSRDFNDHSKEVNQITQPDWCKWDDSDIEYIPSESESDVSFCEFVAQKQVLGAFDTSLSEDLIYSDTEDEDYKPEESKSDSSFSKEISDTEVEYLMAESENVIKDISQKRDVLVTDMDVSKESESDIESNELLDSVGLELLYREFITNIFESDHTYGSDNEDSDYLPFDDSESEDDVSDEDEEYIPKDDYSSSSAGVEISDGEINHLLEDSKDYISDISGRGISRQTVLSSSDSSDDSEVSTEDEQYEDFKILLEEDHELSDSDSVEYQKGSSASEISSDSEFEMEISDVESNTLVNEVNDSLVVSGKRKRPSVEHCESGDSKDSSEYDFIVSAKRNCPSVEHCEFGDGKDSSQYEMSSDEELFTKFVVKPVVPEEKVDIDDSDEEFMLPEDYQDSLVSDSSEEEIEISDTEIKMVKDDLEISSEEEFYEVFKSTVIKLRKPESKGNEKIPTITDNQDLIYFINSSISSDLKNLLDNGKYEKAGVIPESFTISSEPAGMAVAVHGADWRSAHVFEDASSTKSFALVVATDMGPLSNFKKDWEVNFPRHKWTSVSETKLVFNMNDYLVED